MDRKTTLERRLSAYRRKAKRFSRLINLVAGVRIAVFLLGLIGFSFAFDGDYTYHGSVAVLVAVAGFLGLMVAHDRIYRSRTRCETLIALLQEDLARATWQFGEIDATHAIPFPEDHPFADDLDLTGNHSLLKAIDNTFHARSKDRLRSWLNEIDPIEEILARQEAVTDLTDRKRFRLSLSVAARLYSKRDLSANDMDAWLEAKKPWTLGLVPYLLGRLAALTTVSLVVLTFVFGVDGLPWWQAFVLQVIAFYIMDGINGQFVSLFMARGKAIAATSAAIDLFERMKVRSSKLEVLQKSLIVEGKSAGPHLKKLLRLNEMLEYRANGFAHILLNGLFLWDQHYLRSLALWRDAHGHHLPAWVSCVFEVEALSALANFRWLYPGRPYPELLEGETIILEAVNLAHPSIPDDKRVGNDYLMKGNGRLHLITGSNMSGKSTFLRTIGLNLILARLGVPVCAEEMRCSLPQLMTSIRITDSLEAGVSYFYAEVQRIKQILDQVSVDEAPVFYLLDEILKGTNSRERLIATESIVRFLLDHRASGLITTHDLELLSIAEKEPDHVTNYHFQESAVAEEMFFDYQLKPGRLTSTNALRLMKQAGVPLDL